MQEDCRRTGAGISCSSGIPDFRSSDGLYSLVKEKYPDVVLKGRDLFDASLFRDPTSTAVFHTFIAQLKQSIDAAEPGPTHHFIQLLDTKKKLLRSYTQNIDGFEARTGLLGSASHDAQANGKGKSKIRTKEVRNVQLHGDIHRVRCRSCSAEYPCTQHHLASFLEGLAPECPECLERAEARIARSALRRFVPKPDMLIIMGTSLKVHGLKKLVKEFAKTVHSLAPSSPAKAKKWVGKVVFWAGIIDYHVAGETDAWVEKVTEDWKKMRPVDWEFSRRLWRPTGTSWWPRQKAKPKKPRKDEENVPPLPTPMVLGTPNVDLPLSKIISTPPLSPSKRRQTNSHYTVESSPSKRRTFSPMKGSRIR
ncbi:DHS-like NAD/FAD-binding domain-containing protein, partial [Mycena olivaceomarginata]